MDAGFEADEAGTAPMQVLALQKPFSSRGPQSRAAKVLS
jgi:hypothetical protein